MDFEPKSLKFSEAVLEYERYVRDTGFELNANSLLTKNVGCRWYRYNGKPVTISSGNQTVNLTDTSCFGLKENAFGYELETDIQGQPRMQVSLRDGYVLSRMSVILSRRNQWSNMLKIQEKENGSWTPQIKSL